MPGKLAVTRQRLVRAAEKVLIANAGHMEMQAVAKAAKVSVGLAYHHFGSKAGLIAAVVEQFYQGLEDAAFSGMERSPEGWAATERARVLAYIRYHYDHPFAVLVIGALSAAPEVVDVETAFTARQLEQGALNIRCAQELGILPPHIDPDITIALMVGSIRQALLNVINRTPRPDPEQLTDDIWQFVSGGLRLSAAVTAGTKD